MTRMALVAAALGAILLTAPSRAADDGWVRQVTGRTLTSTASPQLRLKMAPGFRTLKPLRFRIADLTQAERRIFVEASPDHRIRRMVIVQFEHALPGSEFRFRYPSRPPQVFGASTYRFGAFSFDQDQAARLAPGKEADHTAAFLKAQGYRAPPNWDVARLARVTDPEGLTEVIIFYMEAIPTLPQGERDPDDGAIDDTPDQAAVMLGRLKRAVTAQVG